MTTPVKEDGNLPEDLNLRPIQIGGSFVTQDDTGTPQTSPLSYSSAVITIAVPTNALEFIVNPSTDMRISDIVGMARYDVIAANTKEAISVAEMDNVYIIRDSADGTVNFRFTMI